MKTSPRPSRRLAALAVLLLLAVPLLSGCFRVQVSMAVSQNDRVSGQMVIAAQKANDKDKGPQLHVPAAVADRLNITPYDRDGLVGSQVIFSDFAFGELAALQNMTDQTKGKFDLTLTREGDQVILDGKVDLKGVPEDGTDVTFTMAFPARVAATNGTRVSDSVVTWRFNPGELTNIRAEVRYSDPNTRSFAGWAGIVAGVAIGVALIVAAIAFLTRSPQAASAAAATAERFVQRIREKPVREWLPRRKRRDDTATEKDPEKDKQDA